MARARVIFLEDILKIFRKMEVFAERMAVSITLIASCPQCLEKKHMDSEDGEFQ